MKKQQVLLGTFQRLLKRFSEKFALFLCLRSIATVNKGKRVTDLLISWIANRINNISNHTKQIYDLHCLCNILVVKIPRIKVCNPSPFRKTCFETSLTKQIKSHVLFQITFHVFFFSLSHIFSSLFRIADGSKQVETAFNKIGIFN